MKLNRRAGVILTALVMCYIVAGVYAGTLLSNELTTSWTLHESASALELYWVSEPTGPFYTGSWTQAEVGLRNLLGGTHESVTILFTISVPADKELLKESITIEYWQDEDGDTVYEWKDMSGVLSEGAEIYILTGYFGPITGFPVGATYEEVTLFQIKFDGNAPLTDYAFTTWVEEIIP